MNDKEPIRVLHVVGTIICGGIENLVMDIYRNIDREKVQFDFIAYDNSEHIYDDEIKALGGKIIYMPRFKVINSRSFKKAWKNFFKTNPQYHIIHIHKTPAASVYIKIAKQFGLKVIVHSHQSKAETSGIIKRLIIEHYKRPLGKIADYRFACSKRAGEYMFGRKASFTIINNGINTKRFVFDPKARKIVREEFGLKDDFAVLHVGRFNEVKNHVFLIDVFAELAKKNEKSKLVLLGDGALLNEIKGKVNSSGISDKVVFLGNRGDVEKFMQAADVFCLPSFAEGFPIVAVEAQASGLPILASTGVPIEINLTDRVKFLSLAEGARKWAEELLEMRNPEREGYDKIVSEKGYDISITARRLVNEFYLEVLVGLEPTTCSLRI